MAADLSKKSGKAGGAMQFYVDIFKPSKIKTIKKMKTYSLNTFGVIGGQENDSHIYIKNLQLRVDHFDKALHSHPDSDEYYVILEGKISFEHPSGEFEMESGDIICFSKNELHRIKKVLSPSKVMIIKNTGATRDLEI